MAKWTLPEGRKPLPDDLVKRLRDLGDRAEYMPHMHHVAADRIEELEADLRKMALDCLAADGQAAEAYQAQLVAEAKLVDAMEEVATYSNDPHLNKWARKALAELKGEK